MTTTVPVPRRGTTEQAGLPAPLLRVTDLHTEFPTEAGAIHAVNGVHLTVAEGEIVGLVGETGSGKSVTARSILGLLPSPGRVVRGRIEFRGQDLVAADERSRRAVRGSGMGLIPQNPWGALNPVKSLETQFRNVIRAHRRASRKECREIAAAMLDRVGIPDPGRVLDGYAHQLSGGMAQRTVIAMALVLNPRLLIADEPTTGLDVTVQRQVLDLVAEIVERDRRAMLLVTHDLGVVAQYCHRVQVMYGGRIVESGPVTEVLRHPSHPYTAALLRAVPQRGKALAALPGFVPDLLNPPVGCAFAERCPEVMPTCTTHRPEVRAADADRTLACHLEEGVRSDAAAAS
ncbi:ABC transporter ATP-binding protein [Pseudonocardia pini]|uniref:ABC transporter ATP-binding protein n=1 Tax=Pseudonocardia pini TaxID=2758030 RepID=UPI0015F0049B|nr:ABC transporter ATP-binding protein [Pseudonocardia pini]